MARARLHFRRFAPALAVVLFATPLLACGDDAEDGDEVNEHTGKDASSDRAGRGGEAGRSGSSSQAGNSAEHDGGATQPDAAADAATADDDMGGGKCEEGQCDFSCDGACEVECLAASCTASCPDGGCTLDADLGAVASYSCEGGGCEFDCDGASDCTIDCPGGGCIVGCDGDSTCKVSCGEDERACEVFCEAGATASCDNDNCEITGCEACDASDLDESYMPSLEPADYTNVIDNPYMPLPVGAKWEYEGADERVTLEVLDETYTTASGVECVVVHDQATDLDGEVIEDTLDWFAQDLDGNVWYFGEQMTEYVNGMPASTRGSWEAGVDGALPGIVAHAVTPEIGTQYRQEYYRCEAEDMGEIVGTGESVDIAAGQFDDCIRVHEYTPLEPNANEHKLVCPGVGVALVYELAPGETTGGEVAETLVSFELP